MDSRPIGVFDSGVGGLTVLKRLVEVLPGQKEFPMAIEVKKR